MEPTHDDPKMAHCLLGGCSVCVKILYSEEYMYTPPTKATPSTGMIALHIPKDIPNRSSRNTEPGQNFST